MFLIKEEKKLAKIAKRDQKKRAKEEKELANIIKKDEKKVIQKRSIEKNSPPNNKIAGEKISDFDAVILNESGLVRSALKPIKILGYGDIDRKINIKATSFSETAKNKIEKAGGTAIVE